MADGEGDASTRELKPLVVIVGPTASGKTRLAVALARVFHGEIVGADSRQVYRGFTIGTGKAREVDLGGVAHHLIDVVEPEELFTLVDYIMLAEQAIEGVYGRGKLPLVVGGTGLYIRGVCDGLVPPAIPPQPRLRAVLHRQWEEDPRRVWEELVVRDPVMAKQIDRRNRHRVIRALEVCIVSGQPVSAQRSRRGPRYRMVMIGLSTVREQLHRLADERLRAMLAAGFVAEVRGLLERGIDVGSPAFSAVGYRELAALVRRELDEATAIRRIEAATHAYQRRQLIWFRADQRIHWLDCLEEDVEGQACALVRAALEM